MAFDLLRRRAMGVKKGVRKAATQRSHLSSYMWLVEDLLLQAERPPLKILLLGSAAWELPWHFPSQMNSCCDSRSRRYRKKRGWSTHSQSRCANHGCDGLQGDIRITWHSWVARSFWMTLLSKGNGGNMYIDLPCQSWDRAPPVLAAPELET